jgi:hypothetical protein
MLLSVVYRHQGVSRSGDTASISALYEISLQKRLETCLLLRFSILFTEIFPTFLDKCVLTTKTCALKIIRRVLGKDENS